VFCWNADFVGYDDPMHITENPDVARMPDLALLVPRSTSTYFPLTILSYQIDHALFSGWMPRVLGTWAPGVRLMTLFYHTLAALIVWRVMLRLGLSSLQAFFVAAAFAVHPMACETVCWTSE